MQRQIIHRYADPLLLVLLSVVCYLLFFHGLREIGFIGPDEPRYAEVARGMYISGDYVTPRLHALPWFEKPVLLYWGAALGYALFGVNELGARFPSALSATITVFLIYWCGRKLWGRAVGIFAALVVASSVGFFSFARAAATDMPLTACLTSALLCFLIAYNEKVPRRRRSWFNAFYICLGLGILAKGPIAVLLPGVALLGFTLARRRLSEWKDWHPKGALLGLAVAAPWYVACTWINGYSFVQEFIINHNIERFVTEMYGHTRPLYFYGPVLLMLTFPWTFLLIPACRRRFEVNDQLLIWWAVVPLVFFSFSGSKLPGYILPIVPPLAILCAKEVWRPATQSFRVAVFIEAGAMIFIGVAFGFFGQMLNIDPHVNGMVIMGVTFAIALALIIIALWLGPPILAVFNLLAMTLLVLAAANFVFPRFDRTDTMRPWSNALETIAPDMTQTVCLYKSARWMEYGIEFYRHSNARGIGSPQELVNLTQREPRVLCIAEDKALDELSHLPDVEMEVVRTIGNQTAFWAWKPK
jgi:4-amino-4-deoxy-L-arabinose transferase-like glycosyltransferase